MPQRPSEPEAPPIRWEAEALWEQLSPLLPGLSIEVVEQLESTNTTLLERLRRAGAAASAGGPSRRSGDLQPSLLVAVHQTRGRGRQGRSWQSSGGASLTFSLAVSLERADWSGLSLAVGTAIADALDAGSHRLMLKWPNDLWLAGAGGERKLGGILIEAIQVGPSRLAVIGVGINVLEQRVTDVEVEPAFVSELDPQATPPGVLARIARPLVEALQAFDREGFAAFAARYAQRDLLLARPLVTSDSTCPQGTGAGVDADGALLVDDDRGIRHRVVSGGVSARPLHR